MKKFFIDQHGCAKNQVDGEIIISKLMDDGFEMVDSEEKADIIIINTCGFIESAKKESLDALCNYRALFPKKKILFAGCLAERYADFFKEQLPEADGIFGNGDLLKITEAVKNLGKKNRVTVAPQTGISCYTRKFFFNFKNSAYVKITEGCSNHCSFCAIPVIRGELRSRGVKEIIAEIKELLKQGFFEINLIGQDLAAYGTGEGDKVTGKKSDCSYLALLLKEISKIKGNFWIRLLYIHPDHFNKDIIECIKNDSRILSYFDIPFQSGDTEIIHSMNRTGSYSEYVSLIKNIRKELPDAAIRTTLMTGFPGETEDAFANSLKFLKQIEPDWSGCFSYSAEDDTPAKKFKNKVPKREAEKRARVLEETQSAITEKRLKSRIGKFYDVLVEEVLPENEDGCFAIGRAWFEAPDVDGAFVINYDIEDKMAVKEIKPGKIVRVKALRVSGVDIDSVYAGENRK